MLKFKLEQLNRAIGGGLENGQLCVIMGRTGSGLETIANSLVFGNDINVVVHLTFEKMFENNFNITKYKSDICSTLLKLVLNRKSVLSNGEFSGEYDEKSKLIFQNIFETADIVLFFSTPIFYENGASNNNFLTCSVLKSSIFKKPDIILSEKEFLSIR